MGYFSIRFSPFTRTRLILSLWYSFILCIILLAFSLVLSLTYSNDVTRIVLQQDFGNHVPRSLSPLEMRLVLAQVRELRSTSRLDIIVIDAITVLVGAGLSYFLAGKTLSPIQKSMNSQKLFIADASHELKSPITVIQSACEVVLRSKNKSKEDYQRVIEQVLDQSQRLGRLVNDLLLLSVLDTGSATGVLKDCILSDFVEKEIDVMSSVLKKSGLEIHKNIALHIHILGDIDKLQQLVVILLDNAIKYTPRGGKIIVKVVNMRQPQLIVEDTGIGIPIEKQGAIFRRFYQAEASHTGSGAGLGLAIAESIMYLHKGHISVQSIPGKGSIFTCTFPRK